MRPPLAYAVAYIRRGLPVFPCRPRGKEPITGRGCLDATLEESVARHWWRTEPDANLAIATGRRAGCCVLDVDGDDGEDTLRELEKLHGALPRTVESLTGKGRHIWFAWPESIEVRNSAKRLGAGLDTRGEGGYVLVEPSIHPSGRMYAWEVDHHLADVPFAAAPQWLLEKLTADPEKPAKPPEEWRALVGEGVSNGARNDSIARLSGHLLRRYVDPYLVLGLMQSFNATRCRPPLDPAEVEQTVNSIARRELARRGAA